MAEIWNNGCKAGGGDAECIPAPTQRHGAPGSAARRGPTIVKIADADGRQDDVAATVVVPASCDVEVTFASYRSRRVHEPRKSSPLRPITAPTRCDSTRVTIDLPDCGWHVDPTSDRSHRAGLRFWRSVLARIDWAANEGEACEGGEQATLGSITIINEGVPGCRPRLRVSGPGL